MRNYLRKNYKLFNMDETILQLKNTPFVTALREDVNYSEIPKKHIIIEVSKILITEEKQMLNLYKILDNQSFFNWSIHMTS